jgi:hypothetical protein
MTDEAFEDLAAALEWGAQLDLTPEQRSKLAGACHKIAGTLTAPEAGVPSWRLRQEAERRRAAEEALKPLQERVAELERALKATRNEWCFRRGKSEAIRVRSIKTEGLWRVARCAS